MVERARQPPTPHDVSHRNIHQREQYDYRRNKSNAQRFLRGVVRFFGGSGNRGFAVRARRAVACLLHSRDNRFLGSRTLNAHVARQKIDGARRNAAQLFHGFFHSRRASRAAHSADLKLFHFRFTSSAARQPSPARPPFRSCLGANPPQRRCVCAWK